jgi:Glycosyltransferase family 87
VRAVEARDSSARPAAGATGLRRLRPVTGLLSIGGCITLALGATLFAVRSPQSTDFAGVAAVTQVEQAKLGCMYSRPVQLAGARLVPGMVAPASADGLAWHYNEPPVMTLLAAPLASLPISVAVDIWEVVLWACLLVCAALAWLARDRGGTWLTAAVIAGLLLNHTANTDFSLAQNDAALLLATIGGLALLQQGREAGAGVLLGLAAVKPQLMFLALLALLMHRRWRTAGASALTFAAVMGAGVLMVGPSCGAQWLHSATQAGELQIGIGLPSTLARLTGSAAVAEATFACLAVGAVAFLWRVRNRLDTHLLLAIAIALAVVIGVHTLAYDVLLLVPIALVVARRRPRAVLAATWGLTLAQAVDSAFVFGRDHSLAPVRATEVVPAVAVLLAVVVLLRNRNAPDRFVRTRVGQSVTAWS